MSINNLIGRAAEINVLKEAIQSPEAELIAVYGRRRVGKTYLIRTVYENDIVFETSGLNNMSMANQLENFSANLTTAFSLPIEIAVPKNWLQAFRQLIQLLEPPFDKSDLNPGYIKGYVPGVRENGGQYTHAAVWLTMAFAKLGDQKRVWELMNIINPINHGKTSDEISVYKVEPYVIAADVYARAPHVGRGGWTWYTGSAGWMYRLITEYFLGLQQEGDKLKLVPCIPDEWESFTVHYRYGTSIYHIVVTQTNSAGEMQVTVDGEEQEDKMITLTDGGVEHNVLIYIFTKRNIE